MVWWELTIAGMAFAIFHVALGWLLGRFWWPSARRESAHDRPKAAELRHVARQLAQHVTNVNREISEHRGRMHQVNRDLAAARSEEEGPLAQAVLASVAEILRINARLQSQLEAAETRLQQQGKQIESWMTEARTDPLTGLANRRAFDDALKQQVAQWRRMSVPFSVVVIDIDHFKSINDQYGHPAGDAILRQIADVFAGTLRRMDIVARVGGEEFAAILPSTSGVNACLAAEHCRLAVSAEEFRGAQSPLRLTVSAGVATVDALSDESDLVAHADQALYAAKQAGRNCVYLHNGNTCVPANVAQWDAVSLAASGAVDGPSAPGNESAKLTEIKNALRERVAEILR